MPDHASKGGAAGVAPPEAEELPIRLKGLSELPVPVLKQAWTTAWGTPPPKGARRRFLMLGIAWQWQVQIHGGFSRQMQRRLATLEAAAREGHRIEPDSVKPASRFLPGARLVRDWRGERHEVHVTEGGYIWHGQTHASLSAIARAITGSRRKGPAFFGLRDGAGVP